MSMISELVKELRWIADYEYQNRNSEATIRKAADTIEMLSEKARITDTPQTNKTCDNCGTPRDKCLYCVEEDRMWTPQTERRIDRDGDVWEWRGDAWYCIGQADTPQTDIHGLTDCDFCKGKNCEDCEGGKDEPQTKRYYAECYDGCNWAVGSPQCEGCEILPKTEWYEKCVKTEPQTDCGANLE